LVFVVLAAKYQCINGADHHILAAIPHQEEREVVDAALNLLLL